MPPAKSAGPIPPFPATTSIPTFKTTSKFDKNISIPSALSFYYAGISSIWLWYEAPLETARAYLEPLGMTPYNFGGKAAINVNFFNAVCFYGTGTPGNQGLGGFNETELNIAGFATAVAPSVPTKLSLQDYLTAGDPTKRIGNYRVWVACDDPVAVACGIQVFLENKFLVAYTYDVPGPNNMHAAPKQYTYDWNCQDTKAPNASIYQATMNLAGLASVPGNGSEIIDLSYDTRSRRPVGSRRNYFGMYNNYFGAGVGNAVSMSYGKSKHPMRHDMQKLIGKSRPVAIQLFQSPSCIGEAAGYYADL